MKLEEALARMWLAEDGTDARDGARGAARIILDGFYRRPRWMLALRDFSDWADTSPTTTLEELAATIAWELAELDTDPAEFVTTARRRLEQVLDGLPGHTRRAIDTADALPLDTLHDPAPDPLDALIASDMADAIGTHPDLTPAERRVARARMELGPEATGAEIASVVGCSRGSERELTRRLRVKLRRLVDKSGVSLPVKVGGHAHRAERGERR